MNASTLIDELLKNERLVSLLATDPYENPALYQILSPEAEVFPRIALCEDDRDYTAFADDTPIEELVRFRIDMYARENILHTLNTALHDAMRQLGFRRAAQAEDGYIDGSTAPMWQWRTAATGTGMVADAITAGVLQANLVKIFGTDRFFWDAANIHIIDPANSNREISIGLYDGEQYGIGYTRDGGISWQNAIGFDGVHFSMSSIPAAYKLDIIASHGVMLSANVPTTQLLARVYCGADDVTSQTPASRFAWTRISNDNTADTIWNLNHRGMKAVTITTEDVKVQAAFCCDLLGE